MRSSRQGGPAITALLCAALAGPAGALGKAQWAGVDAAAQEASTDCLHLMHHDTDEFSACVDAKLKGYGSRPASQLGAAYLGLVGCLSAGRIATLHADVCARGYRVSVDRLRAKLRVSDQELCPIVRGDCAVRIAQIDALRRRAPAEPR